MQMAELGGRASGLQAQCLKARSQARLFASGGIPHL